MSIISDLKINLTPVELREVKKRLGREPNPVELGMIDVMWSEHCSYKSSKLVLKKIPTQGSRVIVGPGYDSGIVDIGDGDVVAFKIESHNHPSAIDPYNGAATGIGGIIRDILCTNCRPIALLDSLRFGELKKGHNRWLFQNVIRGIADYGNCCGIPTVSGEIEFDVSFEKNCLVNVACFGFGNKNKIVLGRMENPGDILILLGGSTGRDGIHGVTFASKTIDESSEEDRPSVQIGDPFTKKMVIEATLEALSTSFIRGLKDLGGGGLTCALSEMTDKGGVGAEVDIDKIHTREAGMLPHELMLSESQERMLFVIDPKGLNEIKKIFDKWEIKYSIIGRVNNSKKIEINKNGEIVASLPPKILTEATPIRRKSVKPNYLKKFPKDFKIKVQPANLSHAIYDLLCMPTIASKKFVYQQYDHEVGIRTIVKPGSADAAILRIIDKNKAIAVKVDCNSNQSYLDPFNGTAGAVAESIRNVVATGAEPIAIADCCNFGNPENPEIFWQFNRSIDGLTYMLKGLSIPCIGGNVSFYNEDESTGIAIKPTVVIVTLGLIENMDWITTLNFKERNHAIIIIGRTHDEMGGSHFSIRYKGIGGRVAKAIPKNEKASLNSILKSVRNGFITASHDCSKGGLAIALAKMAIEGGFGAKINLKKVPKTNMNLEGLLFSESHARFVVTSKVEDVENILKICNRNRVPASVIGNTSNDREITFTYGDEIVANCKIKKMKECWKQAIPKYIS